MIGDTAISIALLALAIVDSLCKEKCYYEYFHVLPINDSFSDGIAKFMQNQSFVKKNFYIHLSVVALSYFIK